MSLIFNTFALCFYDVALKKCSLFFVDFEFFLKRDKIIPKKMNSGEQNVTKAPKKQKIGTKNGIRTTLKQKD
jgi:hypothetical protein